MHIIIMYIIMCIIYSKHVYYSNADIASGCNFVWCVLALLQDMAI